MTITQLRCFLVLTEHLNFTRAAEAIFISQTTLSQHISKLEEELGVKLFVRKRPNLELTPEGVYLKNFAEMTLREIDEMPESLRNIGALSRELAIPKVFTIGVDYVAFSQDRYNTSLFISACTALRENFPKTELVIQPLEPSEMQSALIEHTVDVAIGMVSVPKSQKIKCKKLKSQPVHIVMHYRPGWEKQIPTYEDLKQALREMDIYIGNFSAEHTNSVKQWLLSLGIEKDIHFADSSWLLQLKVHLDNVIAVIPPHRLSSEFTEAEYYSMAIPQLAISRYIVWNTEHETSLLEFFLKSL